MQSGAMQMSNMPWQRCFCESLLILFLEAHLSEQSEVGFRAAHECIGSRRVLCPDAETHCREQSVSEKELT